MLGRVTKSRSSKNGTIYCFVPINPDRSIILAKTFQDIEIKIYIEFPFARWGEYKNDGCVGYWEIFEKNQ
jgi:hypothetical protein